MSKHISKRLRSLLRECENTISYVGMRLRLGFLRAGPQPRESDPQALFVSLTHLPVYALMEGMLLLSLRLRRVRPVVLTYRSARWAIRTFRVLGVRDFLFWEDFLPLARRPDDDQLFDDLFSRQPTFKQLLDFSLEGSETGARALSTVVRKLRTGGGGLHDAATLRLIRSAFLESLHAARAAKLLFEREAFAHVLFHEKGYSPFGEIFDAAVGRSLDTMQYYFGQLPNTMVFKRYTQKNRREHPFSLSRASWEAIKSEPWSSQEEDAFMTELRRSYSEGSWFGRKFLLHGKREKSPEEVREQLHLDPTKKTAVIYSHILWDATFFYGENLFDDYEQWLVETVKAAARNDSVQWIIKLHPDYVWKMKDMLPGTNPRDVIALQGSIGTLPPHIQVVMPDTDITTYSFFAITDYCITVRGTIGIEAPCFGIPVFTAGTGRYSGMGFTIDSSSREEYLDRMRRIQEYPKLTDAETRLARRHAQALFERRLWKHTTFDTARTTLKGGTLDHHVHVRAKSFAEVEQAKDLRAFADWILQSSEEDYLVS